MIYYNNNRLGLLVNPVVAVVNPIFSDQELLERLILKEQVRFLVYCRWG